MGERWGGRVEDLMDFFVLVGTLGEGYMPDGHARPGIKMIYSLQYCLHHLIPHFGKKAV